MNWTNESIGQVNQQMKKFEYVCVEAPEKFSSYVNYEKAVAFVKAARAMKRSNNFGLKISLWDEYQEWAKDNVDFPYQSSQTKSKSIFKTNHAIVSAALKKYNAMIASTKSKPADENLGNAKDAVYEAVLSYMC